MKKITIKEIAKLSGVSVSTVSNVINGKGKCSLETREKVFNVMKETNYKPNQAARTLASKKSNLIGILFPIEDEIFRKNNSYRKMLNSITEELSLKSYDLVVGKNKPELDIYEWSVKRDLEGLIIIGDIPQRDENSIKKMKTPIVFIDNYENNFLGVNYINSDDTIGGFEATATLIENGCKKIAFIGDKDLESHRRRYLGYQDAMIEYSLGESKSYFYENSYDGGSKLGSTIASDEIDGLCVSSDRIALGVMAELLKYKKIPKDVKVIGFDNSDSCDYTTPSLSSIDLNYQYKGRLAVKNIFDEIADKKFLKNQSINLKIEVRGSIKSN